MSSAINHSQQAVVSGETSTALVDVSTHHHHMAVLQQTQAVFPAFDAAVLIETVAAAAAADIDAAVAAADTDAAVAAKTGHAELVAQPVEAVALAALISVGEAELAIEDWSSASVQDLVSVMAVAKPAVVQNLPAVYPSGVSFAAEIQLGPRQKNWASLDHHEAALDPSQAKMWHQKLPDAADFDGTVVNMGPGSSFVVQQRIHP